MEKYLYGSIILFAVAIMAMVIVIREIGNSNLIFLLGLLSVAAAIAAGLSLLYYIKIKGNQEK